MIILTNKPGRLANRLFLFAHFIADAIDNRRTVLAPLLDEYAPYFGRFVGSLCPRYPQPPRRRGSRFVATFRHVLFRLLNKTAKTLDQLGLRQSPLHAYLVATHVDIFDLSASDVQRQLRKPLVFVRNYFFHNVEALRRHRSATVSYLAPRAAHTNTARNYVGTLRKGSDLLLGVHVRRGDYRRWRGGRYYYSDAQYRLLMRRIELLFPNERVRLMVCSDEPIDPAFAPGLDWATGPGSEIEDLIAFSLCDYLIGPPSSYTRWAAFVGNVPLLVVENPDQDITLADFKGALDTPWASHQTVSPTGIYTPRDSATGGEADR